MEEASIVAMVRTGNIDAFGEIVEHYPASITRYLYRLTGDFATAQDLAQDTFVQAYKAILKTDSELKLKAWLYRIATNNAWQHQRRKKLLAFIPLDGRRQSRFLPSQRQSDATGERIAIEEALLKVPAEQRTCLVLHYVEGFTYPEIGETLGISEEAARKRVARGKEVFRRSFRGGEVQ